MQLVDISHNRLSDSLTQLKVQRVLAQPNITYCTINQSICTYLVKFSWCEKTTLWKPPHEHDITHHITTTGSPVSVHPWRLPPEKLKIAHQEFKHVTRRYHQPSSSSWSSPLHMMPKKNPGNWHPCSDHHALNNSTVPDRCPILHIQNFTVTLYGANIFSKLDWVRAYHQTPVEPTDVQSPHLSACWNVYVCLLASIMLLRLFRGLLTKSWVIYISVTVYVYIDDVLIASTDADEHKQHMQLVLNHFQEYGFIINSSKCQFVVTQLNFLGHNVDSQGICPLPEQVQAIQYFPQPKTQWKLREFLGLVTFYYRFIPLCAHELQPLHKLLTPKNKQKDIQSTNETSKVFTTVKKSLIPATLLVHLKPDAPTNIMSDASDHAVEAMLQQFINNQWCPVPFFSKKLKPAETKYSTFDRELLAVYWPSSDSGTL